MGRGASKEPFVVDGFFGHPPLDKDGPRLFDHGPVPTKIDIQVVGGGVLQKELCYPSTRPGPGSGWLGQRCGKTKIGMFFREAHKGLLIIEVFFVPESPIEGDGPPIPGK